MRVRSSAKGGPLGDAGGLAEGSVLTHRAFVISRDMIGRNTPKSKIVKFAINFPTFLSKL